MNGITQTTSELTLEQCDDLLITGVCNIRDAILGYTKHGLTQPQISERVKALGFKASVPTIKRHVADLRKEGLLDTPEPSQKPSAVSMRKARANSQGIKLSPCETTPTPEPTNVLPHHPAPTLQQQCVQADDWSDATVVTAEVVTMPDGEQDFQRAQQLFDELFALSKRNFANGWTELQWNELGGKCRTLAECCDARGKRQRSSPQRQVFAHAAN